jgi:hypothetical protein
MAIGLQIPGTQCHLGLDSLVLHIEGPNGLLPNLDFVSSVVKVAEAHELPIRFPYSVSGRLPYWNQLRFMAGMLLRQAAGFPKHIARSFLKYRIEAFTLEGREAFPRENSEYHSRKFKCAYESLEGILRCMNNVIERLHQSYFFYILLDNKKFVSLSTAIAVPLLLSASLAFKALDLFVKSGSSNIYLELGICLATFFINFALWNCTAIFAQYCHLVPAGLAVLAIALLLVSSWLVKRFQPNQQVLKGCTVFILSIAVLATSFLNMGLAIVLGSLSLMMVSLDKAPWILRCILLPSTILMVTNGLQREYVKEILLNPLEWNFGIPFIVIQPVFIQMLSATQADITKKKRL